jgi:hypothetical protein
MASLQMTVSMFHDETSQSASSQRANRKNRRQINEILSAAVTTAQKARSNARPEDLSPQVLEIPGRTLFAKRS